VATEFRLLADW